MIEILTALKDGKTIQFQDMSGVWCDIEIENYVPNFEIDEYRIKPDMLRCKVGLFKDNANCCYAALIYGDAVEKIGAENYFIRWLTDWIEHEEL